MTDFLIWFYQGFNGLGGWIIFLALALAGMIIVYAHSLSRRIPAVGWKILTPLAILMVVPAVVYRLSGSDVRTSLNQFTDTFFYLGVIGGIVGLLLAAGYLIVNWEMVGCNNGHVYAKHLGTCPDCPPTLIVTHPKATPGYEPPQEFATESMNEPVTDISARNVYEGGPIMDEFGESGELGDHREKAQAWLVDEEERTYQLFLGETTIGRLAENDIQLKEKTLGRRHAKIIEENGHYRLVDLDSTNFTRVNGHIIHKPTLIESDDELQFGDTVKMTFKC